MLFTFIQGQFLAHRWTIVPKKLLRLAACDIVSYVRPGGLPLKGFSRLARIPGMPAWRNSLASKPRCLSAGAGQPAWPQLGTALTYVWGDATKHLHASDINQATKHVRNLNAAKL